MSTSRRKRAWAAAVATIGLVLVVAAVSLLLANGSPEAEAGRAVSTQVASSAPPATSSGSASASPTPSSIPSPKPELKTIPQAPPTRLKIPSIGVDAEVGQVAVSNDEQGQPGLNPPDATWEDLARVYWWNERQAPGNPTEGTTFILGHTCHSDHCPAVFNNLQAVRLGALIIVETQEGTLTYRVWKVRDFPQTKVAGNDAVNADHLQGLTLITCKLRADGGVQTERRVVWAKLVDTRQK